MRPRGRETVSGTTTQTTGADVVVHDDDGAAHDSADRAAHDDDDDCVAAGARGRRDSRRTRDHLRAQRPRHRRRVDRVGRRHRRLSLVRDELRRAWTQPRTATCRCGRRPTCATGPSPATSCRGCRSGPSPAARGRPRSIGSATSGCCTRPCGMRRAVGSASLTRRRRPPTGRSIPTTAAPLICQLDRYGSIDASIFTDLDSSSWILWKSEENAYRRASAHATSTANGSTHRCRSRPGQRVAHRRPAMAGRASSSHRRWSGAPAVLAVPQRWLGRHASATRSRSPSARARPVRASPLPRTRSSSRRTSRARVRASKARSTTKQGNLWLAYNPSAPFLKEGIRPLAPARIKFAWFGPYLAKAAGRIPGK